MRQGTSSTARSTQEAEPDSNETGSSPASCDDHVTNDGAGLTQGDMDRVYTTIRQFVRDWSHEGKHEREKCYQPIMDAVKHRYPDPKGVNVLVPGAGLGRLVFDFASLGYNSEGNEFSIFMLIGSHYILNETDGGPGCVEIYPWCTQSTNHVTHADRVAQVLLPDVDTGTIPDNTEFGMCAGDFTEVYAKDYGRFDVVAASFFLDTAHNIIEYLEIIYSILKPGGHLISLGPLLFHYAGMPKQPSIEVPWEDVESIIRQVGFQIEEIRDVENVPYIDNRKSMLNVLYRCKFFVAQKPP